MGIKSNAFGRVTLTDDDAKKFRNQVTYGKPKPAAMEGVKRGMEMVKSFQANNGKITIKLKRA